MNVWNNRQRESSAPNPKGSWLGALSRSLRNWWDKFFWLEARPERSQSPDEAFPPVSVQEEEDTATAANLREPVDAAEDWLALVRESAPELLVPQEDGTLWFQAPEVPGSPAEELGDEVNSVAPAVQHLPVETPTRRIKEQAATHRESNVRSRNQGTKRTWFHFFRRKAEANTGSAGSTSAEAPLRNDRESSSAQVGRVGSRVFPKANSRNLSQDHQPSFSENHSVRMPARPVMESSRRKVHEPSGAGVSLPLFRNRSSDETNPRIPQQADLHSGAARNDLEQPANVDRISPKPASALPIVPVTSREARRPLQRFDSGHSEVRVAPLQITRKAARPASHHAMWPALPRNGSAHSTLDRRLSFTDDFAVGKQNFTLEEQTGLELRWPDLLEDQPSGDLGCMESFRTREHLHALDVEQQGGS
jgi:hypothetical protein